MGLSDCMIEVSQRLDGCRGQSIPLRIGPNSRMLGQVFLDHDHEGRDEMESLMAAERDQLKP